MEERLRMLPNVMKNGDGMSLKVRVAVVFLLLQSHALIWRPVGAQDVVISIVDPVDQERLCPNQSVTFQCQFLVEVASLTWRFPSDSIAYAVGELVVGEDQSKEQFTANVTDVMSSNVSGFFLVNSTLTVQPALDDLNGTMVECEGVTLGGLRSDTTEITLSGSPSPPRDISLTPATQGNETFINVTIQWDSPTHTGNGLPIQTYTITVPEIDYSVTVDCSDSSCSRTFPVDGNDDNVMFNTVYDIAVDMTAINTCGMESSPTTETGTLEFMAHEPPPLKQDSLKPVLQCRMKTPRRVNLIWEYGKPLSSGYTPSSDSLSVDINGPIEGLDTQRLSDGSCANLTPSNTNCSFYIIEDGNYSVALTESNEIGSTTNSSSFDLNATDVLIHLNKAPRFVNASLNPFCENDQEYTVMVSFGIVDTDGKCQVVYNESMDIVPGGRVTFLLDTERIPEEDENYCANVIVSSTTGLVTNSSGRVSDDGRNSVVVIIEVGVAVGIAVAVAVDVVLVLGLISMAINIYLIHAKEDFPKWGYIFTAGAIISIVFGVILGIYWCCYKKPTKRKDKDDQLELATSGRDSKEPPPESNIPEALTVAGEPPPRAQPSPYEEAEPFNPDQLDDIAFPPDPMYDEAAPRPNLAARQNAADPPPNPMYEEAAIPPTRQNAAYPPPNPIYDEATRPPNSHIIPPAYEEPVLKTAPCKKKPPKKKSPSPEPISPDHNAPAVPEYAPVPGVYQDPKSINRSAHPETGELYTEIQPKKKKDKGKKKKKKRADDEQTDEADGATSPDPQTIEHEQAESGDLYAVATPQKKGKKDQAEAEAEASAVAALYSVPDKKGQKAKSEGLVYAELKMEPSVKKAPKSEASQYSHIKPHYDV